MDPGRLLLGGGVALATFGLVVAVAAFGYTALLVARPSSSLSRRSLPFSSG